MDTDKITQDLNRRFAEPLSEFYRRRIIFWYDEDREFEDQLDDVQLVNATLVRLTGQNTFAVKKLLCEDDITSNFLVYQPFGFQNDDDNWLINTQLYSEEFRSDLNSIWMNEMGMASTPVLRKPVKQYRKFFNAKSRRDAVMKLNSNISTAAQIHLAVMAVICKNSDMQPNHIIKSVICGGLDLEDNEIYQGFVNYGADNAFWVMVLQATGYDGSVDASLGKLVIHILLTAASRTMHQDHLAGMDEFISTPHQAYCYDFVSDWLHSDDNGRLFELARYVEAEERLYNRFAKLTTEDLVATECFPCINECILEELMKEIGDHIINIDKIRQTVEKRRTLAWYQDVSCYYEGISQVANMQEFYLEHSSGFHDVDPCKIWEEYASDYYKMDTYYRNFHLCFQRSLKASHPLLDDLFKQVAENVEGMYSHWYLGQLGENWSDACAETLSQYGKILEIPQQTDFYASKVEHADNRVFVIISDALRYEVAVSLVEQLQRETQSKVNLDSMQGIFPTTTKFGMAALLPHSSMDLVEKTNGTIGVLVDGMSTDAGYRDKILKNANESSVALKYDNIIGLKRADRQELVKGMNVVYIYHDKIDEASHTADSAVFPACDDAIDEIKNLVRIIVNEFGGTKIYITADHGFLYTYNPLTENDKVDSSGFAKSATEYGRRYVITEKDAETDYLLPVKMTDSISSYHAFAPRENVRIKMKGGGLNYVHGGISLQEMVVPLVEYQFLRNSYKTYQKNHDKIDTKPVPLNLLSAGRKISNMIFSLNFYQTEAVGGNKEAATYLLYFMDSNGVRISDTCKVIADKTSENGQERIFRCSFNLRSQRYNNRDSYYLIIADESGLQAPQREEFQIDIAFAVDEFNFFS